MQQVWKLILPLNFSSTCNAICNTSPTNNNVSFSDHELWHYRLGYHSFVKLNVLHDVLDISHLSNTNLHCSMCPSAKQHCLLFPSSNNVSALPFKLVHYDIWGPFHVPTIEGFRYFLTLFDDCSRATQVYLLCNKSDAKEVVPRFFARIHTQFEVQIKGFRSDNAPELQFLKFFCSYGVTHYHTCVETPQQNSVVERKHQHLLTDSYVSSSSSTYSLGGLYSYYSLFNQSPSISSTFQKTPFEVLYHKKPSYIHLRAFGCLCYASTSPNHHSKFSSGARAYIAFLGYPPGYKGYKLLDLETNQVFISKNVTFHETIFPFSETPSNHSNIFSDHLFPVLQIILLAPQISIPHILIVLHVLQLILQTIIVISLTMTIPYIHCHTISAMLVYPLPTSHSFLMFLC